MRTWVWLLLASTARAGDPCVFGADCLCELFLFDCRCPDTHDTMWYGGCLHKDRDTRLIPLVTCAFDEHCELNSFVGGHCYTGYEPDASFACVKK